MSSLDLINKHKRYPLKIISRRFPNHLENFFDSKEDVFMKDKNQLQQYNITIGQMAFAFYNKQGKLDAYILIDDPDDHKLIDYLSAE